MAQAVKEQAVQVGRDELVEFFERLHKHVSGNTYCNMAGCLKLWYKCVEVDRDPYTVCTKEEPVVERYGFVENVVKELSDYVHSLEELWNTAMDTTELFKQGKASLEQAKRAWTRYWNYTKLVERKLRDSERLLSLALGEEPEEDPVVGEGSRSDNDCSCSCPDREDELLW